MANLNKIFEKIASAEDSLTLTKEELDVLKEYGEGILEGIAKIASAEYAIPMSLEEIVKIAEGDKEALEELNEFLEQISGGDEKVANELGSNLTFWVNPVVGIIDVTI